MLYLNLSNGCVSTLGLLMRVCVCVRGPSGFWLASFSLFFLFCFFYPSVALSLEAKLQMLHTYMTVTWLPLPCEVKTKVHAVHTDSFLFLSWAQTSRGVEKKVLFCLLLSAHTASAAAAAAAARLDTSEQISQLFSILSHMLSYIAALIHFSAL